MKKDLRKTKIVGTIGPASEHKLKELFEAGLNVCRINYSHGSWEEQKFKTEEILRLREEMDLPISLLLDTQGPEIRTGMMESGVIEKIQLEDGQKFTLVNDYSVIGNKERTAITYADLYKDVSAGTKILIDDGAIELRVEEIVGTDIVTTVVHGGGLSSRKTMNLPGTIIRLPALKEKDINDLKTACEHGYDYVAASFTRNADDIAQIRKVLDENGGKDIKILTKIENVEGVSNLEEIIRLADGQMIARGDMATELDYTEPPIYQKQIIKKCNQSFKPVITATQMLESMQNNPLPTRAEASDVANAVFDRTGAIMLSGECAQGKYPVECVITMDRIAQRVEQTLDYWKRFNANQFKSEDLEDNIAYATVIAAEHMKADAIIAYTYTGDTPRRLSGLGTRRPILAITDNKRTFHQLGLIWNVYPVYISDGANIDDTIEKGIEKFKKLGILEKGDKAITCGGKDYLGNVSMSQVIAGCIII